MNKQRLHLPNFISRLNTALAGANFVRHAGKNMNEFSMKDFAELAQIDYTALNHYKNGRYKPTLPTLTRMCKVLGVELSYFGVKEIRVPVGHFTDNEPQRQTVKQAKKVLDDEIKKVKVGKGDWRLLELATNQIAVAELIHHDEETNVIILKLQD